MLKAGDKAPYFELKDQDGVLHRLSDYDGKLLVLYFYPKDDTPGCVTEACDIRDNYASFKGLGISVLGVSADTEASHKQFAEKYHLPFPLLSDTTKETIKAYGAWGMKQTPAGEKEGILRTTFFVGIDGTIVRVYENVNPKGHAGELLAGAAEKPAAV